MKAQTATKFQLQVNRSSVHISGIAERTQASTDGMTYAQSACGALTRSYNFETKNADDSLVEALRLAEQFAKVYGKKMCKNCQAAAQAQIEAERVATPVLESWVHEYQETADYTISVTVYTNGRMTAHIYLAEGVTLKHLGQRAANAVRSYLKEFGKSAPIVRVASGEELDGGQRDFWFDYQTISA